MDKTVAQRKSARQRLVQAALQLFAAQGVTETTTRQIADLAEVNEVTLFRHFGSKHGLLLAVLEEAEVFTQLGETLGRQASQIRGVAEALQVYADGHLRALEQIPEFVRSLVGEAGHYPVENREAIGRGLTQIQRYTVQYLTTLIDRENIHPNFSVVRIASLINVLLLGYAVIEFTTEFHQLWPSREHFIQNLVELFLKAGLAESSVDSGQESCLDAEPDRLGSEVGNLDAVESRVMDLPAPLVRDLMQTARKSGQQDYALAYVLFGAGLSPDEISQLRRSHMIYNNQQHVLQVIRGVIRQVPLNQWIMGHRYGSYTKNPLTQWLKARKDDQPALFINDRGDPISAAEICLRWQEMTSEIVTPSGQPPFIQQAQDTWRVEMLMRGLSPENLSILAGCTSADLDPYVCRAQARAALEQAIRLDQRPGSKPDD